MLASFPYGKYVAYGLLFNGWIVLNITTADMNLLSVQYKIHIPQSMETRLISVATFIEPHKTFEVRN